MAGNGLRLERGKTMSTVISPEVSKKNKYWIERHRYYELKHFCMQYPIWKKAYIGLDGMSKQPTNLEAIVKITGISDPTVKCAEAREFYAKRIEMVENTAKLTDEVLGKYILMGITEGISYDIVKVRTNIPCGKDMYYSLYRKFF